LPQVTQVVDATVAQVASQISEQQVGDSWHTALQQSASEQYGPLCGWKQSRVVPSALFSPQPPPVPWQLGLRRNGVSLLAVMASGPLVRLDVWLAVARHT